MSLFNNKICHGSLRKLQFWQFLYKFIPKKDQTYYIDDDILINNFYKILAFEYGFEEIFIEMGVKKTFNFYKSDIPNINCWIESNDGIKSNSEIELIKQLEIFRDISSNTEKFEDQLNSIVGIYEQIISTFKNKYFLEEYDLGFLAYKEYLENLKKSQDFSFKLKEYRRDNCVHQFRVFLLGCFIIYSDKNFWIKRTWESMLNDFKHNNKEDYFSNLYRIIKYNLEISIPKMSEDEFKTKSIFFMWMISSLFHDVGRSIEDSNDLINEFSKTYSNIPYYNWGHRKSNNDSIEVCELFPSSIVLSLDKIGTKKKNVLFKFINKHLNNKIITEIIEELIQKVDHGAISAVLVTDHEHMQELESNESRFFIKPFRSFYSILAQYSLISISLHNLKRYFYISPLTQLLIIVDTLQEWDRITKHDDNKQKIYPCYCIKLKISDFPNGSEGKIIEGIIPYEKPNNACLKKIFNRRKPDYEKTRDEFKESRNDETIFNRFFNKGVELRIGYIEDKKIFKFNICGICGNIIYEVHDSNNKDLNIINCSYCKNDGEKNE